MEFVRNKIRFSVAAYTRPADTNAYAAGDVVADSTSAPTILTFPRAVCEVGGESLIQSATLVTSANVATKPDLQLWLFDRTVVMDNDNAAFTPSDAEMLTLLHIIAFPTGAFVVGDAGAGAAGNAVCNAQALWLPIRTAVGDNAIYGILVARNAYVPVSAEVFTVRLGIID